MRMVFRQKTDIELPAWLTGLVWLYCKTPDNNAISLCIFKAAGLPFCPGCGLGHGIHHFLHGHWALAFHYHWFAPLVTCILIYRTGQLAWEQYTGFK
ncbi:DUF2752 domain-containing protein [Chitinophaga nivalis]|uniref:DUF2752 domain-containing protein n=1 Tax=Chitinophaga nivalis TaxID=2991709 RepID=A0ABT3IUZ4_9BACT|nr:DUF2752 domain-containing protein [Chitinophaga nivalis]MCW3462502.1 DUF2752 domain-containing protein [Chitinophaga nivalis]MCW3487807.1 DUF2752 domain-containing protein [Chitinophaga nivalis]